VAVKILLMKHTLILLSAFACTVLQAQRPGMGDNFKVSYDSMDQLKVELNLSEEQLARWNEVNETY